MFNKTKCVIKNACDGKVLFVRNRCVNIYSIDIDCASSHDKYFFTLHNESWLWHIRLTHASMNLISKISKDYLVKSKR